MTTIKQNIVIMSLAVLIVVLLFQFYASLEEKNNTISYYAEQNEWYKNTLGRCYDTYNRIEERMCEPCPAGCPECYPDLMTINWTTIGSPTWVWVNMTVNMTI